MEGKRIREGEKVTHHSDGGDVRRLKCGVGKLSGDVTSAGRLKRNPFPRGGGGGNGEREGRGGGEAGGGGDAEGQVERRRRRRRDGVRDAQSRRLLGVDGRLGREADGSEERRPRAAANAAARMLIRCHMNLRFYVTRGFFVRRR